MSVISQIAFTFIRRKNSRWPAFTAIFSVLGVAFGVSSFLVVVTIFNSFEAELKQLLAAANPHLIIYNFPNGIPNAQSLMSDLKHEIQFPIRGISRFEYAQAVLSHDTHSTAAVLRGIEGTNASSASDLERVLEPKNSLHMLDGGGVLRQNNGSNLTAVPPIILGKGLATKLDVQIGEEIVLSAGGLAGGFSDEHVQKFKVVGFMNVGLSQYDDKLALVNFFDATFLFGKPNAAKGIEIQFYDLKHAQLASTELQKKYSYSVRAIQDLDRGLFEQVERDGSAVKVVVLIITIVAAFNIIATLYLGVLDRSKQIAILRSLGADPSFIVRVFVVLGTLLGFIGGVIGIILGAIILKIFSGFELGELQSFYFVQKIPVYFDWKLFLLAFSVALILAFLSALYPAWKATRVSPLHGLHRG